MPWGFPGTEGVAAMIETILEQREERICSSHTPHLSYSRINRYLHCPEQYRLYYVENLRLRAPSASRVFGQIVHQALAYFFQNQGDAIALFQKAWGEAKHVSLTYSQLFRPSGANSDWL